MEKVLTKSNIYGKLILLVSILIAAPVLVVPFYPEDAQYISSFLLPAGGIFILGVLIILGSRSQKIDRPVHDAIRNGSITVLFIWVFGFVAGALPFFVSGQLTFVQALFESVSGWTTTGLSVMDVEGTPHIFLFHRGFMQFCGGLGFIMVMVMFIQGKQAMSLYSAEGHPDKLMPNLGKTARTIFQMYFAFLIIGTFLYTVFGMELFDSIIHAMCALSTGGFSTKAASIGYYQSVAIEAITILLMLIGTTNFAVLLLFTKGKIRQAFRVSEVRFMIGLILFSTLAVACSLFFNMYSNAGKSVQLALFNTVSALSTTGYATVDYAEWPMFGIGVLILLMVIGGGIGSTAGGIKMSRVYLMLRIMKENIKKRLSPSRTISHPYYYRAQGKTYIEKDMESDTSSFIGCYLIIFITGSLLITATADCSLTEAMFDFASSLGTVGLSIGITGPGTNNATLLIEMFGMMMGRLEIFIVIMGIYSGASRVKQMFLKARIKTL